MDLKELIKMKSWVVLIVGIAVMGAGSFIVMRRGDIGLLVVCALGTVSVFCLFFYFLYLRLLNLLLKLQHDIDAIKKARQEKT